jgi:hypothetical protein
MDILGTDPERGRAIGAGEVIECGVDGPLAASTTIATQIPVERWHDQIGDPTADAILDCLFHNAYRLELRGKSMRPGVEPPQNPGATDSQ